MRVLSSPKTSTSAQKRSVLGAAELVKVRPIDSTASRDNTRPFFGRLESVKPDRNMFPAFENSYGSQLVLSNTPVPVSVSASVLCSHLKVCEQKNKQLGVSVLLLFTEQVWEQILAAWASKHRPL